MIPSPREVTFHRTPGHPRGHGKPWGSLAPQDLSLAVSDVVVRSWSFIPWSSAGMMASQTQACLFLLPSWSSYESFTVFMVYISILSLGFILWKVKVFCCCCCFASGYPATPLSFVGNAVFVELLFASVSKIGQKSFGSPSVDSLQVLYFVPFICLSITVPVLTVLIIIAV